MFESVLSFVSVKVSCLAFFTGFVYEEGMVESQRRCMACLIYFLLVNGLLVSAKPSLDTSTDSNAKPNCDFTMKDSSGEILSPNYPAQYPDDKECTWKIEMPLSQKIVLVFETFNLDRSPSSDFACDNDFVEVHDNEVGLIGKYCAGYIPPRQLTSRSNMLRVIFKSDNWTTSGFNGNFRAIYASCGGFLTDTRGDLLSPSYPESFPADIQCVWQIRVPLDYVIELRFSDFNMDGMYPCSVDYVKLTDGFNTTATELGHFCATRPPKETVFRSTGNKMSLEYRSYKESNSAGFKAHYARVPHCNGFLESDYGRFTSPGYPGSRQMDRECNWLITVTEGKIVSLMFEFFEVDSATSVLSSSRDCGDDYVELFDGTSENDDSLGRFCTINNKPMGMLHSSGRQMLVKLHTSFRNMGDGFLASYYGIDPDNHFADCDVFDNQLFFTCNSGQKIQCQWKCDGTNDCSDGSDERHCAHSPTTASKKSNDVRNYVIVILSITGSALAIICIGFIVDQLRRKRTSRPRRRRNPRRLRRPRLSAADEAPLTDEPSSPPPPYELASDSVCFDVTFIQPRLGFLPSPSGGTTHPGQNSRENQSHSQVSADGNQDNSTANVRTDEITSNSFQADVQEICTIGAGEEDRGSITGNAVVSTLSPSESISSINDTAPLIRRTDSVIEL